MSVVSLLGCGKVDPTPAPGVVEAGEIIDPFFQAGQKDKEKQSASGNCMIEGQIFWEGPIPRGREWLAPLSPLIEKRNTPVEMRANPYFPKFTETTNPTKGLGGVLVALVDGPVKPNSPWVHGPLNVTLKDSRLFLEQDGGSFSVGLIRPEDSFTIEMENGEFETIRGRGAAFFAAPFVKPKVKSVHKPRRAGIIDLASGTGHFWMQGMIIASPTPLITRSDQQGKFRIEGIPVGQWNLICFRPNHLEKERERDGETLETYILDFADPVQAQFPIQVQNANVPLRINASETGFTLVK